MTGERGKQVFLVVIFLALAATFFFRFRGGGGDPGGGSASEGIQAGVALASLPEIPVVPWDRLEAGAVEYNPKGRNLFQFGHIPPPPPTAEELAAMEAARKAEEEARRKQEADRLRAQRIQEKRFQQQQKRNPARTPPSSVKAVTQPKGPPPPPDVPFKFIGYLGPAEEKIAVLVDGEDFFLGRVGEVVGNDFRIVEIGYEWIQIGYTDPVYEKQTRRIPMGE